MFFTRTCSAAAAVSSCTAAHKDDHIARFGHFSDDVVCGSSAYYSAHFHSLCNVVIVINFIYLPCGKTDLVAVGTVSGSGFTGEFFLRQFAVDGLADAFSRVSRARYTHCLIYINSSRKRVSDCAAKTCCRAAERLDLCRMIVSLVLEHNEPVLFFAVYLCLHLDAAGVDFFGLVHVIGFPRLLQVLGADAGHIHKAYVLVPVAVNIRPHFHIVVKSSLNQMSIRAVLK